MVKSKKDADKKAARTAEKKTRQQAKSMRKQLKEIKGQGIEDIENIVASMDLKVKNMANEDLGYPCTILPAERLGPRVASSYNIHPITGELLIFGGEYYDGQNVKIYHDLYKWNIERNEWKKVILSSPQKSNDCYSGGPKPRCSHQSVIFNDHLFIHGGEYSTEHQFYHFRDLWKLNLKSYIWYEVKTTGLSPSPRSGHRMVVWRHYFVVFGGFHDTFRETRYFNDIHILNTQNWHWTRIEFDKSVNCPLPRSGVQMITAPNGDYIFIYGGYSKVKDTKRNSVGKIHLDCWILDMKPFMNKKGSPIWERVSRKGQFPSPRSGSSIVSYKNMAIIFGGVFDQDDSLGITLKSMFFNDLYGFDLQRKRWYKIGLVDRKGRKKENKNICKSRLRKDKKSEYKDQIQNETLDSEEFSKSEKTESDFDDDINYDNVFGYIDQNGQPVKIKLNEWGPVFETQNINDTETNYTEDSLNSVNEYMELIDMNQIQKNVTTQVENVKFNENFLRRGTESVTSVIELTEIPLPRINSGIFVKGSNLYIYGGLLESGNREITMDDCWCFNLSKKDKWKCILEPRIKLQEWREQDESDNEDFSDRISVSSEESSNDSEYSLSDSFCCSSESESCTSILKPNLREKHVNIVNMKKKYWFEIRKNYNLDDERRTPKRDETLREFFNRTRMYWITLARESTSDQITNEKELVRYAFSMALDRINEIQPYLTKAKELEEVQNNIEDVETRSKMH
ncbi:kelch motif family protein [Cryptosporidium serpentis]